RFQNRCEVIEINRRAQNNSGIEPGGHVPAACQAVTRQQKRRYSIEQFFGNLAASRNDLLADVEGLSNSVFVIGNLISWSWILAECNREQRMQCVGFIPNRQNQCRLRLLILLPKNPPGHMSDIGEFTLPPIEDSPPPPIVS